MRTNLLIIWSWPGGVQKVVIELKVLYKSLEHLAAGLEQTQEYMDPCGTAEGHLVIFDRTSGKTWEDKPFRRRETARDTPIQGWGIKTVYASVNPNSGSGTGAAAIA